MKKRRKKEKNSKKLQCTFLILVNNFFQNDNKAVSRIQKGTPDVAKKAAFSPVSYSPL